MVFELHGDPADLVAKGANAPGKHNSSMLQDVLLSHRMTEVDFMNGAIVKWRKVWRSDAAERGNVGAD